MTDHDLLEQYLAAAGTPAADEPFAELVRRHLDLVHASARRQVGPSNAADDITQAVFLLLTQKAHRLRSRTSLAGWLFETTRWCAANWRKHENRKRKHEREAAQMHTEASLEKHPQDSLTPLLDAALAKLASKEREAVLLRYLQGKSIQETSLALGISPDAAAKRAARGLEKLRAHFSRQGYTAPAPMIASLLTSLAASHAPQHLTALLQSHAANAAATALAHGAARMIWWTNLKLAAAIATSAAILLTGAVLALENHTPPTPPAATPIAHAQPAPDLNTLLDRLQKHYDAAFGDYLALETETDLLPNGQPDTRQTAATLYAQSGTSWLANRFLLGDRTYNNLLVHHPAPPANWPTPAPDAALAAFQADLPADFLLSDGRNTWQGYLRPGEPLHSAKLFTGIDHAKTMFTLPSHLWPTRLKLSLAAPDTFAQIITDPMRPTLIGLQIDQLVPGQKAQLRQDLRIYWLDPAKDDLPAETLFQTYSPGTHTLASETLTTYTSYAQTPAAQWYPTAWTTTATTHTPRKTTLTTEYHLQLWPHQKLPAAWFQDPAQKPDPQYRDR